MEPTTAFGNVLEESFRSCFAVSPLLEFGGAEAYHSYFVGRFDFATSILPLGNPFGYDSATALSSGNWNFDYEMRLFIKTIASKPVVLTRT